MDVSIKALLKELQDVQQGLNNQESEVLGKQVQEMLVNTVSTLSADEALNLAFDRSQALQTLIDLDLFGEGNSDSFVYTAESIFKRLLDDGIIKKGFSAKENTDRVLEALDNARGNEFTIKRLKDRLAEIAKAIEPLLVVLENRVRDELVIRIDSIKGFKAAKAAKEAELKTFKRRNGGKR